MLGIYFTLRDFLAFYKSIYFKISKVKTVALDFKLCMKKQLTKSQKFLKAMYGRWRITLFEIYYYFRKIAKRTGKRKNAKKNQFKK